MTTFQTISIPEPTISIDGTTSTVRFTRRSVTRRRPLNVGLLDVTDLDAVVDVAQQCAELVELLELHHHHEDGFVQALVGVHAPDLAIVVETQHLHRSRTAWPRAFLVAALVDADR